jgi:hypothetical protein
MEELLILTETCKSAGISGTSLTDARLNLVLDKIEQNLASEAVEILSAIGLEEIKGASYRMLYLVSEALLDSGIVSDSGVDLTQIYGVNGVNN